MNNVIPVINEDPEGEVTPAESVGLGHPVATARRQTVLEKKASVSDLEYKPNMLIHRVSSEMTPENTPITVREGDNSAAHKKSPPLSVFLSQLGKDLEPLESDSSDLDDDILRSVEAFSDTDSDID
jgi:hypothetical protein